MKVKSESEVAQSCPTLCDSMDCSLPGSSIHDFPGKNTGVGCHCLLRFWRLLTANSCDCAWGFFFFFPAWWTMLGPAQRAIQKCQWVNAPEAVLNQLWIGHWGTMALLPCPLDERAPRHVLYHLSEFTRGLSCSCSPWWRVSDTLCMLCLLFPISCLWVLPGVNAHKTFLPLSLHLCL